jgi:hypothetical protein
MLLGVGLDDIPAKWEFGAMVRQAQCLGSYTVLPLCSGTS